MTRTIATDTLRFHFYFCSGIEIRNRTVWRRASQFVILQVNYAEDRQLAAHQNPTLASNRYDSWKCTEIWAIKWPNNRAFGWEEHITHVETGEQCAAVCSKRTTQRILYWRCWYARPTSVYFILLYYLTHSRRSHRSRRRFAANSIAFIYIFSKWIEYPTIRSLA